MVGKKFGKITVLEFDQYTITMLYTGNAGVIVEP